MAMRRGSLAVLAAATTATVVGAVITAPAAEAQSGGDRQILVGNFVGATFQSDEMIAYTPGPGPDRLLGLSRDGLGDPLSVELSVPLTVNGTYQPIVGDFVGDLQSEVIWYAPGPAQDWLWEFDDQGIPTSTPLTINGTYIPVTGDFRYSRGEIIWYAPGPAQDYEWEFQSGEHTSAPLTINGNYQPIVGRFLWDDSFGGNDDIFWYAPGPAPDYLWDTRPDDLAAGNYPQSVNGVYEPFALDMWADAHFTDDIFWYAPGPGADTVWDFPGTDETDAHRNVPQVVNGDYDPVAAGQLLGDDNEDVVWAFDGGYRLWDFAETEFPDALDRWDYTVTSGPAELFP